jgi:hypothetical protein
LSDCDPLVTRGSLRPSRSTTKVFAILLFGCVKMCSHFTVWMCCHMVTYDHIMILIDVSSILASSLPFHVYVTISVSVTISVAISASLSHSLAAVASNPRLYICIYILYIYIYICMYIYILVAPNQKQTPLEAPQNPTNSKATRSPPPRNS